MLTAKEWMDFPGVIHIGIDEEPPEATVPKVDQYGNPLKYVEGDIKYLIRSAYFSNNTYVQAVSIRKKKKSISPDVRKESQEQVRSAYEEVKREAEELRRMHHEKLVNES